MNTNVTAPTNMSAAEPLNDRPKKKKTKIQVKAPTQERSRQTVSTILEAASKILIREGFFGVTTDKIAKEAGVSIGSLYQFFGNKESVVSAVIHNMFETDQQWVTGKVRELEGLPLEQKVRRMIDMGVQVYMQNAELRKKLQNIQVYLTDSEFYANTMKGYQDLIMRNLPQMPGRNPQKVAYIIVTAFIGLLDRAIIDMKDLGADKEFQQELERLFVNYLK